MREIAALTVLHGVRGGSDGNVALGDVGYGNRLTGKNVANGFIRLARQIFLKRLVRQLVEVELLKEALDSVGNFGGGAAIADGPRDTCVVPDSTTDAEVVGIDHLAVHSGFLAFEADVSGPMLAAAIGAAGDVQLQLVLIVREAIFELIGEPTSEGFRFGEGQLAEFRTGASNCAADESGGQDREATLVQRCDDFGSVFTGNVDNEKILHGSRADVAVGVLVGEISGQAKLLRGDAAAENVGTYGEAVGLLLRDYAEMVAVKIGGQDFRLRGIKCEAKALLNGG